MLHNFAYAICLYAPVIVSAIKTLKHMDDADIYHDLADVWVWAMNILFLEEFANSSVFLCSVQKLDGKLMDGELMSELVHG